MRKWRTTEFCENCYKEWCCTHECEWHLLHRVKEAREKIEKLEAQVQSDDNNNPMISQAAVLNILDKLISESEANIG